jgi:hypothetical protein
MSKFTGRNYTQKQADIKAQVQQLSRRLNQTLAKVPAELQQEFLVAAALDVAGRAMRRAPVDTGHLRESGWVEVNGAEVARGQEDGSLATSGGAPPAEEGRAVARITFNATTDDGRYSYALIQHEETEFGHPRGGEAKYLERSMAEVADDFQANFATAVARALKRRGKA